MSSKKSTDSFYKRLPPMAESTKSDDTRRNHSSGYHQSFKNTTDPIDRQMSSHSSLSNVSSLPSGRGAIDAQTYVDAQSNGLTQRIVRYEEENKKTPNVYNRAYKRPGDFPIVHLDKPKLVLTPKRSIANPPKMARIGQPDPCINRTSIRAEILRNGTMMPVASLDRREDVDNVRVDPLDALKEISRKRIHCEDTINQIQPGLTIEKDTTDAPTSPTCNNSKRQRIASSFNSPSSNETNKRSNSYSKSNEILSSLSSSSYMLSDSLKRAKVSSPNNSISPPQAKRLQMEKPIEAPPVDTPVIVSVPKPVEKVVPEAVEKTQKTERTRPKLTLFNRPYSTNAPILQRSNTGRSDECNIPFVKPRPMTVRQRESIENWFKVKPDEKRRLSLMLKCLSGEVDDDSDTIDSGVKITETPKPANPVVAEDSSLKPPNQDKSAAEKSIAATVVSTAQIDIVSKTSIELPTKPAVTFNPVLITTAPLLPTTTTVQATTTAEERKGGFSFPLAPKTTTTVEPTTVVSSTPPLLSSSSSSPAATVTPSVVALSANATSKDALPTVIPSVTFTFNPSKPKVSSSSPVVTAVEPTKGFTFGNDSKNSPVFGISAPPAETARQTTSSTLEESRKPASFGSFGQTNSTTGNIDFGKGLVTSAAAPSTTFAFGSTPSSNTLNKAQPPSFGSIQNTNSDKTIQPNKASTFSTNGQTSVFGSNLSNTTTSNTQKPADPRISNVTTSLSSNPAINSTSTLGSSTSFVFGASTNTSATIKTAQPVPPATSSFGGKPTNSTSNMFGSMAPQQQQQGSATSSIFGAPATTNTNLFGQTPRVDSIKTTEPEKNAATQNIFGSPSAPKPSSTFAFSANNQANTNNIFGSQTLGNSGTGNSFNFGGSTQKPDSSGNSLGTSKSFNFSGNNSETKPTAFGTPKNVAPTFGTTNVSDSAKSVGFAPNNQTSSTNLFTNTSTNQVPKVFSFGGASNPPNTNAAATFGGTSSAFGSSTAFGAATPTFGGPKATPSIHTPAFGSTGSTPSFRSANATPTFGSANSTPAFGNANATSAFGSSNATPSFTSASATPTFGSANSTPSFGSANATPSFGTANATPSFGSANAAPSFGTANAAPSFGSASATPSFGSANATPAFGGGFGGTGFTANSGTPSFGTNSNNNSNSAFGGSSGTPPAFTTSTGTGDANRTFNFTGTDPAPSPVPNLFNIGPGNSAPRGRTIRTATRRAYR